MKTKKIYDNFLKHFSIKEIVSKQAYETYKSKSNYFFLSRFDIRLLETMILIRESLGKPITVNNWAIGGPFSERGLRDNLTYIVRKKKSVYISGHVLGMALDFDVQNMTANEVRKWLKDNQDILPYRIRLENKMGHKYISWVHLDVCDDPKNPKVYLFNV